MNLSGPGTAPRGPRWPMEDDMKPTTSMMMTVTMGLCAAGCAASGVQGDGHALSETRTVPTFSSVDTATAIDVQVTKGETVSVVVTTDDNLVGLITTRVEGSTLFVEQQGDIDPRTASLVTISVPDLGVAKLDGSGSMTLSGFSEGDMQLFAIGSGNVAASLEAETLEVTLSGSGGVMLSGSSSNLTVSAVGSASFDASKLVVRGASVDLGGSGNASSSSAARRRLESRGRVRSPPSWMTATLGSLSRGPVPSSGRALPKSLPRLGPGQAPSCTSEALAQPWRHRQTEHRPSYLPQVRGRATTRYAQQGASCSWLDPRIP